MLPWLGYLSTTLFVFYIFIQMNVLNTFSQRLLQLFAISPTDLGFLAAAFFIANAIFLIPAAFILDIFSLRKILLWVMIMSVFGNLLPMIELTYFNLFTARFLTGMSSAFCFIGSIKYATLSLPNQKLGLITGITTLMGFLGGMVAQTPYNIMEQNLGIYLSLVVNAGLGFLIFALMYFTLNSVNGPKKPQKKAKLQVVKSDVRNFIKVYKAILMKMQNWSSGLYAFALSLPIYLLGGLWGILYLTEVYRMNYLSASYATAMIFLGGIIGTPLLGWISDHYNRRKPFLLLGALVCLIILTIINLKLFHAEIILIILFFLLGICTSTQALAYPILIESNRHEFAAAAASIASLCTIAGTALFQPLFGWVVTFAADSNLLSQINLSNGLGYRLAWMIFIVVALLAFILALTVRETFVANES